jgi:hypothetical protein
MFIIDPGPAIETHLENIAAALPTLHAEAQAIILTLICSTRLRIGFTLR